MLDKNEALVVVNDDVEKPVRARILVARNVVRVKDLNGGEFPFDPPDFFEAFVVGHLSSPSCSICGVQISGQR